MRKKIAVVGDKGSVLGFKSVGFEVFTAVAQQEVQQVMHTLCKSGDYGIIFITEQAYVQIPQIIDEYKEQPTPAIIPIPGKDGSLGIGIKNVKKNVERAVGADILFND
ncbi:MAG: V-type ATP synthase subunit F [Negativibacillus sp.]|nr:V-type ATP synthase subunit F [Negativibacillus sp.]